MTHVDMGIYGAKRQSWSKANPRALLAEVMEENPRADESALSELFWERIRDDQECLKAALLQGWFPNNYRSLMGEKLSTQKPVSTRQRAAQKAARTRRVTSIKQLIFAVSLNFVLPGGKTLRDSTGTECTKVGGWLAKIGKACGSKRVGNVFKTDEALQKAIK